MKLKYLITLLILSNTYLFSQVTRSASANVDIIVPLSITVMEGDLDFGEIILTGSKMTKRIEPLNGKRLYITGSAERRVTVVYDAVPLGVMEGTGEPGKLIFTPQVASSSGQLINSGVSDRLVKEGNIGIKELWVGGSIDISADQPHGTYSGIFTITVSY